MVLNQNLNYAIKEHIRLKQLLQHTMGFSNSSLTTNTQENEELKKQLEDDTRQVHQLFKENEELKDQIERERYEHRRALMNQEDKTFLEVIKPLEDEVESLQEEILILKMKLASAHENADIQKHNEVAGVIIEVNDRLKEQLGLLEKVKKIYGEENNNWEDDEFFLDACKEREEVFDKYHHGTLVEDPDPLGENKKKLEEATAKAKCLDALVYGIGWEHLNELCDDTTKERLIESGQFVPEDFTE